MDTIEINKRYTDLAESTCCLSCGGGAVTRSEYLQTIAKSGLRVISISEESAPYDKGKIKVASFSILGIKPEINCSCTL